MRRRGAIALILGGLITAAYRAFQDYSAVPPAHRTELGFIAYFISYCTSPDVVVLVLHGFQVEGHPRGLVTPRRVDHGLPDTGVLVLLEQLREGLSRSSVSTASPGMMSKQS